MTFGTTLVVVVVVVVVAAAAAAAGQTTITKQYGQQYSAGLELVNVIRTARTLC